MSENRLPLAPEGRALMNQATILAAQLQHPTVTAVHVLAAAALPQERGEALDAHVFLRARGLDYLALQAGLLATRDLSRAYLPRPGDLPLRLRPRACAAELDEMLAQAAQEARQREATLIGALDLLCAALQDHRARPLLAACGAPSPEELLAELRARRPITGCDLDQRYPETPTLNRVGIDLTQLARDGALDEVVGREAEIDRVLRVLGRRIKHNPALIGEPGVGKTAIIQAVAQRVVAGAVPPGVCARIVELPVGNLVAGTRYRGDFEERMKAVVNEAQATRATLYVDELHTLIGAGRAEGMALDAGQILKPALAGGRLSCVGATTLQEYRRYIEADPALERRFTPVYVEQPTARQTLAILRGLRPRYEQHHGVRIGDGTLAAAVDLAGRFLTERRPPDSALDLLDEAASSVRLRSRERPLRVTASDVARVLREMKGLPLSHLAAGQRARLRAASACIERRLVGQTQAKAAITDFLARALAGVRAHAGCPALLAAGPSAVGKTEAARAMAEGLYGSEDALVRIDMSEYREVHTISRLVGAPPGYVGYQEPGQLTEPVRRRPHRLVLLEEVDKCHPDVLNLLLQIIEDGRLTDATGRTADFRSALLMLTTNLGADQVMRSGEMGFGSQVGPGPSSAMEARIRAAIKATLRPELFNRLTVVVFGWLTLEELRAIAGLLLGRLELRLEFGPEVPRALVPDDYDLTQGAREVRHRVDRLVAAPLARALLSGDLSRARIVRLEVRDGRIEFEPARAGRNAHRDGGETDAT